MAEITRMGVSTSLSAATGAATGDSFTVAVDQHSNPPTSWTWTIKTSGSPTSVSVDLEGSIDGTDWFTLDTSTTTTSEMRHVVYKPVRVIRCKLNTFSGGTNPTLTAKIGAF